METKGLNLRHRYVSCILGIGSIDKHSLFSAIPLFTISKEPMQRGSDRNYEKAYKEMIPNIQNVHNLEQHEF